MICDATGCPLDVGDRIGTVTAGRWQVVLTAEVVRIGAVMITCRVLTAAWSGAPRSEYARLPQPGSEVRLNAWRVFRLEPVVPEGEPLEAGDLRVETAQPGNQVKVTHVPTGHQVVVLDTRSVLEAKAEALHLLADLVRRNGKGRQGQ
jgi:hypothetical protein